MNKILAVLTMVSLAFVVAGCGETKAPKKDAAAPKSDLGKPKTAADTKAAPTAPMKANGAEKAPAKAEEKPAEAKKEAPKAEEKKEAPKAEEKKTEEKK